MSDGDDGDEVRRCGKSNRTNDVTRQQHGSLWRLESFQSSQLYLATLPLPWRVDVSLHRFVMMMAMMMSSYDEDDDVRWWWQFADHGTVATLPLRWRVDFFGLGLFSFLKDDCDNNNNADDRSWWMLYIALHSMSMSFGLCWFSKDDADFVWLWSFCSTLFSSCLSSCLSQSSDFLPMFIRYLDHHHHYHWTRWFWQNEEARWSRGRVKHFLKRFVSDQVVLSPLTPPTCHRRS